MSEIIKWLVYLLGGLTFLAAAGAIYQIITAARDKRRYPPPGRLVNIGDCKLHINCMGAGKPTVVMESGSGNFSLDWSLVQPQIAKLTRVCTYDRAGHGWSGAGVKPRTVMQSVEELHTLLRASDNKGPYVLVGHSLGGLYVEVFARRYPAETAGIVLVDPACPDIYAHLPPETRRRDESHCRKMWLATLFGIPRLGLLSMPAPSEKLPPDIQRIISAFLLCPLFWRTAIEQNRHLTQDIPELAGKVGPFPDIPLVILTPADRDWLNAISPETPTVWLEMQKKLLDLSSHSNLMIVEDSGYGIHLDQPALVVDVICQMIQEVRRQ